MEERLNFKNKGFGKSAKALKDVYEALINNESISIVGVMDHRGLVKMLNKIYGINVKIKEVNNTMGIRKLSAYHGRLIYPTSHHPGYVLTIDNLAITGKNHEFEPHIKCFTNDSLKI